MGLLMIFFSFPKLVQQQITFFGPTYIPFWESLWYFGVTSLMPIIVLRSTEFLGYWSEIRINLELLTKAYICLFAILFVIPMLNPENITHVIKKLYQEIKFEYDWQCLFLPDNGVFFFNNLITFALIGNCARLCRFDHMLWHIMALFTSRTLCEARTVSRLLEREIYWIGERAAWILVHFTVTIGLSLSSPLIMIAGLVYLFISHGVDTYLVYKGFFEIPPVETRSFYAKCITMVFFATWVLQISTSAFLLSRSITQTNYDAFTVSLLLAMPSGLLVCYQHSMRQEGPIQIFKDLKYSTRWSRAQDTQSFQYHPPQLLKDVPFPTSTTHYEAHENDA